MSRYLLVLVFFLFLSFPLMGQYIVTQPESYSAPDDYGNHPFDLEDVDNDNYLDITFGLSRNFYGLHLNQLYVRWNDGSGGFVNNTNYTTDYDYFIKDLAYGNLRNSIDRDPVAVYEDRTEVMWNINNTLSLQQNNLPGGASISLGKITDDIYDDLALYTGSEIKIFINNWSGTFYTSPLQTIYEQPVYMQLVDLHRTNSFYDLVTLTYGEEESILLKIRNNVSGQFGTPFTIDLGGYVQKVIMGDVNYDDYPDLVVVRNDGKLRIHINQEGNISGNYSYEVTNNDFFDYYVGPIAIGDMNNDGWNDLVITRIEGWLGIWINQKTGNLFTSAPHQTIDPFLPYSSNHTLKLADIENTGGLSVLFTSNGGIIGGEYNALHVFRHDGNPSPAPPKRLVVSASAGSHPYLTWNANTERDLDEYWIYKKIGGGEWNYLTSTQNTYFEDENETVLVGNYANETYAYYKLKAVDISNNQSDYSNTASIKIKGEYPESNSIVFNQETLILNEIQLFNNYPNPFNPKTTFSFSIPEESHVKLTIYSITGEKINEFINGYQAKGFYEIEWNGQNENGLQVSSGIYIYELIAGKDRWVKKMFLTK